jgi:hypothetical protein
VQQGDEGIEVTPACGGEERVDHRTLPGRVGVGSWQAGTLDPTACPAGELLGRRRSPADHGRDIPERHLERVVQDERQPLVRRQRVEHDQQGQADRVGQQRLLLGLGFPLLADDRVGQVHGEWLLAPVVAGTQHVQADAGHDHCQPPAEVLDVFGTRSAQPQPGVLNRIVGLAERAEHPVGHRAQARPVKLKTIREPLIVHPLPPRAARCQLDDPPHAAEVTRRHGS